MGAKGSNEETVFENTKEDNIMNEKQSQQQSLKMREEAEKFNNRVLTVSTVLFVLVLLVIFLVSVIKCSQGTMELYKAFPFATISLIGIIVTVIDVIQSRRDNK